MTFFSGDNGLLCLLVLLPFQWLWDSREKSEERILIRTNIGQRQLNEDLLRASLLPQIFIVCLDCKDVKWG